MNRIYQGKVTNVEIANPDKHAPADQRWLPFADDPKQAKAKWQAALWQHHQFFQDAVNYDFAAFAAMIDENAGDAPLNTFNRAVITIWEKYDGRKGQWNLPFGNAARALGLSAEAGFGEFSKTLFARTGTPSTPAQRHAAVRYIFARALEELGGEADAAQKLAGAGRDNWPKLKILCSPRSLSGTTPDTVRYQQEMKAREIALRVEQGGSLSVDDAYAFKTSPERKTWTGDQTRAEIKSRFKSLLADAPELQREVAEFDEWLEKLPADFCVASPGKKPQGDFDAALLLALRPSSAGLRQVFVRKTKWRRDHEPELVENDAVADARVDDIPVFPFLTNLVCSPHNPKKPSFAVWPDFEKLAFIEVFTKIGQLCLEHRRRTNELARLYQKKGDHDERFADDERIKLLRELTEDLAGDRVDEEGHPLPYRIRSRSLKAWPRLREAWRTACINSAPETKTLLDMKKALQKKCRERFGNATLYEALALPTCRSIWLDKPPAGKSSDPLQDWADYVECLEEIEHLEEDPAFTPAHPDRQRSPRFFRWAETNNKEHEQWDGKSDFTFVADALDFSQPRPAPTELRVSFRAPRLVRDGLRRAGEKMDHENPDCDWLPPVLRALPDFHGHAKQTFARVAIRLMPENPTNIQLALEPELENQEWQDIWNSAHAVNLYWGRIVKDGDGDYRQLKWPAKADGAEAEAAWFKRGSTTCLAVDLGIRESGAFKVLGARKQTATSGDEAAGSGLKRTRFSRVITPNDYFSTWSCFTLAEGLLRLRGENAQIYRLPTAQETAKDPALKTSKMALLPEFSGRRGRRPAPEETQAAERLFLELQYPAGRRWPSWKTDASFPEQNDELLWALEAVRSRLYRIHRWAWMLTADDKRRKACLEQVEQIKDDSPIAELRTIHDVPTLSHKLADLAGGHIAALTKGVVEASNRILPSKRGRFAWLAAGNWHEMRLVEADGCRGTLLSGQRGLSTERLTQLQRLRRLVQSLNHLCRHEIPNRYQLPKRGSVPDPFIACGDALEDAREDRAKQIAHLIFAQAMGVELAPPPPDKKHRKQKESLHGVYQPIPNRRPVDFIALEDLSKFRTSEIRGRRENRQLAAWSHRRIVKHLRELCELVGMPIVFVDPAFTSRISARNDGIGFRAAEISNDDSAVSWLCRRADEGDVNAATLLRQLQFAPEGKRLLLPRDGGPIFVELRGRESNGTLKVETKPPSVVHADLNGAHRIGLRALAHREAKEFHSKIWIKESRKRSGTAAPKESNVLYIPDTTGALGGEIRAGYPFPLIRESESLWEKVDGAMAWQHCLEINAGRLKSWGVPEERIPNSQAAEEDDVPM